MASRRRAARRGTLTAAGVSTNSRRAAVLALTAVAAAVCASGAEPAATAQPSQGWELAWADEFDGAVHLRVDAVRIRCGHKQRHGCGIAPS